MREEELSSGALFSRLSPTLGWSYDPGNPGRRELYLTLLSNQVSEVSRRYAVHFPRHVVNKIRIFGINRENNFTLVNVTLRVDRDTMSAHVDN